MMDLATKRDPVLVTEPNLTSIKDSAVDHAEDNQPYVNTVPQKKSEIYFQIED